MIIIGLCAKSEAKSENGEWFFLLKEKSSLSFYDCFSIGLRWIVIS